MYIVNLDVFNCFLIAHISEKRTDFICKLLIRNHIFSGDFIALYFYYLKLSIHVDFFHGALLALQNF